MKSILKPVISFAFIVLCFHSSFAQSYSMRDIYIKADSVIKANIGERVPTEYSMRNSLRSYQYKKGKSEKLKKKKLQSYTLDDVTKGDFCGGEVVYQITLLDKHEIGWESLRLHTDTVHLDACFNLTTPLNIRGIPQYILDKDTTKFLTYKQARQIINDQFPVDRNTKEVTTHYRERQLIPYLELYPEPIILYRTKLLFENNTLRHHWRVMQIIRCGEVRGYIESIEKEYMEKYGHLYETKDLQRLFYIDAITGEVLYKGNFESFKFSPSM